MPRLIFVRHARPDVDPCAHPASWKLSPSGRADATALARGLGLTPGVIVSSSERKAQETAEAIQEVCGGTIDVEPGVGEHATNDFVMLSPPDFKQAVARFFREPDTIAFGVESARNAVARFEAALASIRRRHRDNVVIVTHGRVLSAYLAHSCGVDALPLWERLPMPGLVVVDLVASASGSSALVSAPWLQTPLLLNACAVERLFPNAP